MARIKSIHFTRAETNGGCLCDKCGQSIKNIWTVEYDTGTTLHYGIDCFAKLRTEGTLSQQDEKMFKQIIKRLKHLEQLREEILSKNPEDDIWWQQQQENHLSAWYGEDYETYRKWWLNEALPERIKTVQKDVAKLKGIQFIEEKS